MTLFEDIALFDEGKIRPMYDKTVADPRLTAFYGGANGFEWTADGETRLFKVRHKSRKDIGHLDIPLTHGSFLLMGETMQEHYEHHVPKTARKVGARINLTFRISEPSKPVYFAARESYGSPDRSNSPDHAAPGTAPALPNPKE